jgi:hypothetical protein
LTQHIINLNPLLVPESARVTAEEIKAAQEAEKKSVSDAATSVPSLTPPTTPPLSSSKETDGSAAPAISQSDRECSEATLQAI